MISVIDLVKLCNNINEYNTTAELRLKPGDELCLDKLSLPGFLRKYSDVFVKSFRLDSINDRYYVLVIYTDLERIS